ncbi:phage integrase family site specific recombinase [Pseudomonas amygdali pv. aesculi str. 0893_23]|uniref:tyrosine-type recombinase/integrase n=1 Tax=Pseudomonas syringae group genomosp. 2 TaxID=251698 RepID=UPI0001CC4106|nr:MULTISPECIES: tyrosine-type recombinase/integrase [Pseudomonas syringae group genomosp. 2]EGH00973.1 phage integrase family site specific recombinase [Pseudomonas amygdali pv. aesculi str. 0893_23]KPW08182.1 Phage integrase family site specific recombinase [Pseudomonas amygdali pv. aesculi]MCQ3009861.1 site-specific integrase [Pseudomonas savastanoi]
MKTKITQKLITRLTAEAKVYRVHDTHLPGFFIRVLPSGHMSYMVTWGRNKNATLGRVGVLTLDQARKEAGRYLADAHEHGEPLAITQGRRETTTPTLRAFIDETYMPWFRAHHRGEEKTLYNLDNNFDTIMHQRLDAITGRDLEQLRTGWLNAGNKASTANRKMGSISGVFSRAVDWEYLPSSPLDKIKPLKVDTKGQVRYLSKDETLNLKNALEVREHRACLERDSANKWRAERNKALFPDLTKLAFTDHLKPMVLVSLNTGMRRGELFGLTWQAINFDRKVITVGGDTAKTSETRHIPMNTETFDTLKAWSKQSGASVFVFPGLDGGRMEDVKSVWLKLLQEACITGFRWHDMRHDFASRLVMAGVPLNTVRDLLGHTDIKMTLRYAHLAPDVKAAAVDLLH